MIARTHEVLRPHACARAQAWDAWLAGVPFAACGCLPDLPGAVVLMEHLVCVALDASMAVAALGSSKPSELAPPPPAALQGDAARAGGRGVLLGGRARAAARAHSGDSADAGARAYSTCTGGDGPGDGAGPHAAVFSGDEQEGAQGSRRTVTYRGGVGGWSGASGCMHMGPFARSQCAKGWRVCTSAFCGTDLLLVRGACCAHA